MQRNWGWTNSGCLVTQKISLHVIAVLRREKGPALLGGCKRGDLLRFLWWRLPRTFTGDCTLLHVFSSTIRNLTKKFTELRVKRIGMFSIDSPIGRCTATNQPNHPSFDMVGLFHDT
jgi:hypothetical protein